MNVNVGDGTHAVPRAGRNVTTRQSSSTAGGPTCCRISNSDGPQRLNICPTGGQAQLDAVGYRASTARSAPRPPSATDRIDTSLGTEHERSAASSRPRPTTACNNADTADLVNAKLIDPATTPAS